MNASLFIAATVTFLVFAIHGCNNHEYHETNSNERIQLLPTTEHTVPGPLPIMGALTFWVYSRKLRNRIKRSNEKV